MDISDYNDPFGESIESKGKYYPMVVLTNKKLLNDETYTDLVIKVGSETVHAHAAIVSSRCEEIISFHQDEKSKRVKKKHEVKIKDSVLASGAVMQNVLEYLYTGVVDFPKLSDKDILFLVKGARFFKLDRLSYLCERWLNEHMTIESVFHLLKAATDLNEERIKGFCLHFALQNYNSFISNKDGIYILGIELFQEVVAAFQTNPAPPVAITPENAPPDTLLSDFKRLYGEMSYSDFSVTIGAETIRCHKAILAAHSDVFVSQVFKEAEPNLGISAEAFKTCLRFLYYGEDNVEPLPACELVGFTRKYKLPSLLRICEDKIRTSVAPNTVMQILSVSYLAAEGKQDLNEELRGKCIPFILQNLSKVDLKVIRTCNPLMTVDLLLELQNACKRGDYGLRDFTVSGGSNSGHSGHSHSGHSSRSESSRDVKTPSKAPAHPPPTDFPPPPLSEAGLLGAQRNGRPAPPPRGSKDPIVKDSSNAGPGLPPPVIGAPAPPAREKSIPSAPPPAAAESSEDDHSSKGRLTRKKSQKDVASELKKVPSAVDASKKGTANKKDKKEEDKRKKDELKRIAKEKKERQKMEKKFKGGKGGEIF